jgi:hypothetical protein
VGVVFLDTVGNNEDQSWVAACRDCGETMSGNDAPRELGVTAWTGETPNGFDESHDLEEDTSQIHPCRRCRGSGIDPEYHRRFTTGGHDERPCRECGGTGERVEVEDESPTP